MDGNTRYELTSASPDSSFAGSYQNGQRGYSAPTLGRSSSFREGSESRNSGSSKVNSRVSATSSGDGPALSQCLMLEPIIMGDSKSARPGDLRRVLNFSVGNNSDENSLGSTHMKSSAPVAVDELKRLRASVEETYYKASGRAKKLDEHLNKLNKYVEANQAMPPKKPQQQQRNELLKNERSTGSTLKIGSQMHRNPSELGSQKFDDRPKNGGLNKRLRTSVAENRAECRNNGVMRQSLMMTKERDMIKDSNADSDMAEEKLRRLPAGGEGWEKKMKRKRSVGAVFSRSVDNDGDLKRSTHLKLSGESSLQSSDSTHGFRPGASGGSNKLDPMPSPTGSAARITLKNEQEKYPVSRDVSGGPIKERPLGKVNVKLNNHDENHAMSSGPIVKGKASRAPRSGSMVTANSPRLPGTLESWEQPQGVNKTSSVGGANNRKRALPAGSSSPPITQWVGQRPQKISRTRRTNLIPVSNHDEALMQPEGCSSSDFGQRVSIGGINASLLPKSASNGNQNFKVKTESVPSPSRQSESEESGAGDNRVNDKGVGRDMEEKTLIAGPNVGPSMIPMKKNKIMVKEEIGDGVRRQGRSGRVSPFSRASISPTREKLDNVVPTKPLRNARSGSDKTGSKSGRPLKKLSDRKGFSRLGHVANGGSPDCSGESDDDREELTTAANLASSTNYNACSSAFWKTFEALFASVGPEEKSFLSQQLKLAEESCSSLSQKCSNGNSFNVKQDDYCHEEMAASESLCSQRNRSIKSGSEFKDSTDKVEFVTQLHSSSLYGGSDSEKGFDLVTPIYQRLLSAIILDDEIEEFEDAGFGRQRGSVNDSSLLGTETKFMDRLDFCEPMFGVQTWKNGNGHKIFPCNGNAEVDRNASAQNHLCNGELVQRDSGYVRSEVEVLVRLSRCDYDPQGLQAENGGISFDYQYEQLDFGEKIVLELQSIGLFVEPVPALDDKEVRINQEIARLQKGFHEQIVKKKSYLDKIYWGVQEEKTIGRDPEQFAMDRLVELAYKKLLATRGSLASKHGIPKVSKQVALAFVKRTLARCIKYEDTGASCFSEPALRDIVFAPPPQFSESDLLSFENGPIANKAKKKEVSLDDVGGANTGTSTGFRGISGGAKGKRSDRDRDKDDPSKNNIAKTGRLSLGGSKGERKTKSKPKQKTAQLSMAYPSGSGSGSVESANNRRKDVRFMSSANAHSVSSKEIKDTMEFGIPDIDGIEELGVDSEIGAPQDFNSWFNFDVDGLQDHDSVGLEIPMDDLSELNMF